MHAVDSSGRGCLWGADAAKAELDECLAFCLMRLEAHAAAAPKPDGTDNATASLSLPVTLQEAEGPVATAEQQVGAWCNAMVIRGSAQLSASTQRAVKPHDARMPTELRGLRARGDVARVARSGLTELGVRAGGGGGAVTADTGPADDGAGRGADGRRCR